MKNSVTCPKCKSSSLSASKNSDDQVHIICMNCGTVFKPGEGISYKVENTGITVVAWGYICLILSLIVLPIVFLPLAFIFALCCIVDGYWRILHGVIIIVLVYFIAKAWYAVILALNNNWIWSRFHF